MNDQQQGYKSMAQLVNSMDGAMKGKVDVKSLTPEQREKVVAYLQQFRGDLWTNTPEEVSGACISDFERQEERNSPSVVSFFFMEIGGCLRGVFSRGSGKLKKLHQYPKRLFLIQSRSDIMHFVMFVTKGLIAYAKSNSSVPKFVEHASRNPIQFHIPAHKKGFGMPSEFSEFIGPNALSIDLINIAPLEYLHSPERDHQGSTRISSQSFWRRSRLFFRARHQRCDHDDGHVGCRSREKYPRAAQRAQVGSLCHHLSGAHPVFMHPEIDSEIDTASPWTLSA